MNHKYSTVALILILLLIPIFSVIGYLTSEEIDEGVCGQNNSFLYREPSLNKWICANVTDMIINFTINNVTNIYNNQSVPYIGADRNVNLGDYNLTTNKWLIGKLFNIDYDWIIHSGNNITVNTSKLSTIYYNATESLIVSGTIDAGTLTDTQHQDGHYDGITFNFSEQALAPALDLRMNFTNISDFNGGVMRYRTSAIIGDFPIIQLWNIDTLTWEDYPPVGDSQDRFATIEQSVFDSSHHIIVDKVQMRIYKAGNGNTNNEYYVDWVAISKGFGTPAPEEIDPYSWHRNDEGETGNFTTNGTVTIDTLIISSNTTHINIDGGGKIICFGSCL